MGTKPNTITNVEKSGQLAVPVATPILNPRGLINPEC